MTSQMEDGTDSRQEEKRMEREKKDKELGMGMKGGKEWGESPCLLLRYFRSKDGNKEREEERERKKEREE